MNREIRVQIQKCPTCRENDWWMLAPEEAQARGASFLLMPLMVIRGAASAMVHVVLMFTPWSQYYMGRRALATANQIAAGSPAQPAADTAVCANCGYERDFHQSAGSTSTA